jgi:hypothetical protein
MDKSRFIQLAPLYYALAVATCIKRKAWGRAISLNGIVAEFTDASEAVDGNGLCYLENEILLARAIKWLRENNLVEVIDDDFGSSIFAHSSNWDEKIGDLAADRELPFFKYQSISDSESWLRSALLGVNETFYELKIQTEDFDNPDQEWTPIPLDRTDPALQKAIAALDETVELVRSDNGYNANVPEERNFVVSSLTVGSSALKSETTSNVPFVQKYMLEPLALLMRRFKGAALGVVATAAKEAIIDFLREHGVTWLTDIFG